MRLIALAVLVIGNLLFFVLARTTDNMMEWQMALAMVFSSFAFIGIIVVSLVATGSAFNGLLKSPDNYLPMLTPVSSWKKVLGQLIPSVVLDIAGFVIGIAFIVLLATSVDPGDASIYWGSGIGRIPPEAVFAVVMGIVGYSLVLAGVMFWLTLSNTVLSRVPLRKLIGAIVTIVVATVLNWSNMILVPFGELFRFGPFFNIQLSTPSLWALVIIVLLTLAQAAAFVFATVRLLDRRS